MTDREKFEQFDFKQERKRCLALEAQEMAEEQENDNNDDNE
jgi:hypothetical protein